MANRRMKMKYTVMNIFGTMSKKCCSRHRLAANVLQIGVVATKFN
jgi:hypothetical protein